MKFRFISPVDPDYPRELLLRWEVLLKPLGISPGQEVQSEEEKSVHLIALDRKKLVGCVLFYPETTLKGRIFHMAFSEEYQGKGFGRKMMSTLEDALQQRGVQDVYLIAPKEAVGFYQKMGYHPEGEVSREKGQFVQKMSKQLS